MITCSVALWEIDNHIRGYGALTGLDQRAFNDARGILKVRAKKLAKQYALVKPCKSLKMFFTGFSEFQELETLELDMFKAQQTEIVLQVAIAKFYWVLAKCAYEERERLGIAVKSKSRRPAGSRVSAERVTGNNEEEEEEEEEKVVVLDGENLKMMNKAIEGLKEIEMGLFSNLTEKRVAIDDGLNVIFRWSLEIGGL